MSFVGKVLIVVQVVMSLCFMAFAGAVYVTHENWQTKYTESQTQVTGLNDTIKNLEANLSQARQERDKISTEMQQEADKWKLAFQTGRPRSRT
jgi:hypothetical protein